MASCGHAAWPRHLRAARCSATSPIRSGIGCARRIQGGLMYPKLICEFAGTFWLVFAGCGSAVLAAAFPESGIGFLGVSLAFGLAVLTGAYAFGPISGGHFNPAVSVGLWAGGRFPRDLVPGYVGAQL